MVTAERIDVHPAAETIAAFAEATLTDRERRTVLEHLDRCQACREEVFDANEAWHEERPAQPHAPRWLLAAAAAVALVIAAALLIPLMQRDAISRLAALAPHNQRLVQARLCGAFTWAPYRGPARAIGASSDPSMMKVVGAAGDLAEQADRDRSATLQHAAGVGMLLADRTPDAVTRLRDAAEKAPDDASAWSDLAAAEYTDALTSGRASLYPLALADADHALRLDRHRAEALFNRALILERIGLTPQAHTAWQQYLAVDVSSQWAAEARAHLSRLPAAHGDAQFKRDLPRLERAAAANDEDAVRRFVEAWPAQSRAWVEGQWLGSWGDALMRGDGARAAENLALSREVSRAMAAVSGQSLLAQTVAGIDAADAGGRMRLGAALAKYRLARIAYARAMPREAEPQLRAAAAELETLGSPMALEARYYAACTRFDQNDVAGARAELEALLPHASSHAATKAQIEWELGLCQMTAGDWNAALLLLSDASATFTLLGERSNAAFMETLRADTLAMIGRADESWSARIHSLGILATEGRDTRLAVSLGAASRGELLIGRFAAARSLLQLEEEADRASDNDPLVADALAREAVLSVHIGNTADAHRAAMEAADTARRISDPALRARAMADVDFATGAVSSDAAALTRAIDAYRAHNLPLYLPEGLLLRARILQRRGDHEAARRDLEAAMETLEQRPVRLAGSLVGTGVLDAGAAVYDDAVALALDGGDVNAAFAYAERARMADAHSVAAATDAHTLQRRLASTGAAVLELVALPREVAAICVTADVIESVRRPVPRDALASMSPVALHQLLIAPLRATLSPVRELIVVGAPPFDEISFASLYDVDRQRYLVEELAVATAPSASMLAVETGDVSPLSALAVALPSGMGSSSAALPDAEGEAAGLRAIYSTTEELSPDRATFPNFVSAAAAAEVVHIAGHTARENGAADDALVFRDVRVTWPAIAALHLQRCRVVVLAACETLRVPRGRGTRALSLGGAFAAAGAHNVIGTLAPILDGDARELFGDLHRRLAAGTPAAEALRQTQRRAIAARASDAWHSLQLITTAIPLQKGGQTWPSSSNSQASVRTSGGTPGTSSPSRTE